MRVICFDIDTLRADHLGCYGYKRNTSPTIDKIASEGVRFDNYFCPNAPCLPSRASLVTGQYGIRTGVVGHDRTAADLRLLGKDRGFIDEYASNNLFMQLRHAGMHTVSFSTFAERHGAWWFNAGFNECINVGGSGMESAEEVTPNVLKWLSEKGMDDNWFMHVHYWDPHTPYRAPEEFGNPFENEELSDDWITDEIFKEHLLHIGPHGANEINMWNDIPSPKYPRHPGSLKDLAEVKNFIDQYDCGIKYTDDNITQIISLCKELNIYDDLAIIITSDHGENMGEMGIYGEHATTDLATSRIPLIIKWPSTQKGFVAKGYHDNVDLLPTVKDLLNFNTIYGKYSYDGISFAETLKNGKDCSKESLVLTQCAHVCQRSAIFGDYLYIRTVHGGGHIFDDEMLFNIKEDPHQLKNIANQNPEKCAFGAKIILDWIDKYMKKSGNDVDPLWTVIKEDGPFHARNCIDAFIERIRGTEREYGIKLLSEKYKAK